jgi:hypothetical protein
MIAKVVTAMNILRRLSSMDAPVCGASKAAENNRSARGL